jgi:hypothetical protein
MMSTPHATASLTRWIGLGLVVIALTIGLSSVGLAAADTQPGSRRLLERAIKLCHLGQLGASLEMLKRAKAALPQSGHPGRAGLLGRVLLYQGLNLALMGRRARARTLFGSALAQDPTLTVNPSSFKPEVVKLFNAVRDKRSGKLVVFGERSDLFVFVDGRRHGRAPRLVRVAAGRHRVELRDQRGAALLTKDLTVSAGAAVRLALPPVDGHRTKRGQPTRRRGWRSKLWTLVAAGACVAFSIAGAALWASSDASYDELESNYPTLAAARDSAAIDSLKSSIEAKDAGAVAMFSLAGASAVAAVALFFLEGRAARQPRDRRDSRATQLVPLLQGDGAGLLLRRRRSAVRPQGRRHSALIPPQRRRVPGWSPLRRRRAHRRSAPSR